MKPHSYFLLGRLSLSDTAGRKQLHKTPCQLKRSFRQGQGLKALKGTTSLGEEQATTCTVPEKSPCQSTSVDGFVPCPESMAHTKYRFRSSAKVGTSTGQSNVQVPLQPTTWGGAFAPSGPVMPALARLFSRCPRFNMSFCLPIFPDKNGTFV